MMCLVLTLHNTDMHFLLPVRKCLVLSGIGVYFCVLFLMEALLLFVDVRNILF